MIPWLEATPSAGIHRIWPKTLENTMIFFWSISFRITTINHKNHPWGPIISWRLSCIYWKKYPEPSQAANTITTPVIQAQMMRRVGSQVLLVAKLFYCWVSFSDGMASNKTFRMGLGCCRHSFETTNDFFSAPIPKPWPKRWGRTPSLFQSPGGRGE